MTEEDLENLLPEGKWPIKYNNNGTVTIIDERFSVVMSAEKFHQAMKEHMATLRPGTSLDEGTGKERPTE